MSSTKAEKKIKNKQILNCELGKYCDSDEMGIIFRKKKRNIKQSIIKTVTARKKKSNLEVSNKGKNSTQNVLGDITNWPAWI